MWPRPLRAVWKGHALDQRGGMWRTIRGLDDLLEKVRAAAGDDPVLAELVTKVSASTVMTTLTGFRKFARWLEARGVTRLTNVDQEVLSQYAAHLGEQGSTGVYEERQLFALTRVCIGHTGQRLGNHWRADAAGERPLINISFLAGQLGVTRHQVETGLSVLNEPSRPRAAD